MTDDAFDKLLRQAFTSRPEHTPRIDVARTAVELAQLADRRDMQFQRMAALARWRRLSSAVAAILILMTIVAGYYLWPTSSTTTSTASSTSTIDLTTLVIAGLLVIIVALTLTMVFTPQRQMFRFALA